MTSMGKPLREFNSNTSLTNRECRIWVEKGPKFIELMSLTPEAKAYLDYNADLQEVVDKL